MSMNEIKTAIISNTKYLYRYSWFHLIRPMTLTGTISPALAGTALAAKKGHFRFDLFFGFLIAALMVQAATNMFNDYFDFKNGQDQEKWDAPEVPAPGYAPWHHLIPIAASILLAAAAFIGLWLASQSSYWIVAVGVIGIVAGYGYSAGKHSLSARGLGELTAAIFLGVVPAVLAYVIQGSSPDLSILALSITFAIIISTMILANNIRDIDKDRGFRLTLAMRLGRTAASHLLTALLVLIYVWDFVLILLGIIPWLSALVIFAIPLAMRLHRCLRPGSSRMEEVACMKWAAYHHWAFGLFFAIGLWSSLLLK